MVNNVVANNNNTKSNAIILVGVFTKKKNDGAINT